MRADIDMDRGGELHTKVKAYAEDHNIRLPRAYVELLERGLHQYTEEKEQKRDPT